MYMETYDDNLGANNEIAGGDDGLRQLIELGSLTARSSKGSIHCLTIVGQMVCVDSRVLLTVAVGVTGTRVCYQSLPNLEEKRQALPATKILWLRKYTRCSYSF